MPWPAEVPILPWLNSFRALREVGRRGARPTGVAAIGRIVTTEVFLRDGGAPIYADRRRGPSLSVSAAGSRCYDAAVPSLAASGCVGRCTSLADRRGGFSLMQPRADSQLKYMLGAPMTSRNVRNHEG